MIACNALHIHQMSGKYKSTTDSLKQVSQAGAERKVCNSHRSIEIPIRLGGVEDKPVLKESQTESGTRLSVKGAVFLVGIIKGGGCGKCIFDFSIPW